MNEQEEQPRPSLRLRKIPDRPPAAPPEPPKAPEPAPPSEQKDDAGAAPRPRLSSIIKPASGDTPPVAPSKPPEPSAPPPALAMPPPKPAEQTPEPLPAPEPPPAPKPEPVVAATPPPPTPTPSPPPTPDPGLPVVEAPRPLHFPPPPGQEAPVQEAEPKPPSPRTIGLVILVALVLVVGGVAYLLFADPLGLFKHAEPAAPTPAVVSSPPPKAPPAAATTTTQVPATPAPETTTAPAAATATPKEELPEFKMPPPAPLAAPVAGEEIAPGVVRLPRDAAGVSSSPSTASVPAPRPYEPPPPKQNPAYIALVNNLNITGIRANSSGGYLMIGTAMYRPGDIVDNQTKLEFVSIDGAVITFKDPAGVIYTRRF